MAADARWHLQRAYQLSLAGGRAELFFFDTSPFVHKYYETAWADRIGGPRGLRKALALRSAEVDQTGIASCVVQRPIERALWCH